MIFRRVIPLWSSSFPRRVSDGGFVEGFPGHWASAFSNYCAEKPGSGGICPETAPHPGDATGREMQRLDLRTTGSGVNTSCSARPGGGSRVPGPPRKSPLGLGRAGPDLAACAAIVHPKCQRLGIQLPWYFQHKVSKQHLHFGEFKENEAAKGMSTESPNCLLFSPSPVIANTLQT